jgi:uncharacterized protein
MSDVFRLASTPPVPDLDSAPFWEGCRQRRLLVRSCADCGRGHYPPGPCCPWCVSWNVEWREVAPRGTVRTFVVFRHPFLPELKDALPYAILRVALDERPDAVLHGRLAGDPEAIAIGDAVEVAWEEIPGGFVLPNWRRAG